MMATSSFRAVFNQETLGICRIDSISGSLISANQCYRNIFGYPPDGSKLPTQQEITHPDNLQAYLENMRRLLSGAIRQFSMEMRCLRREGSYVRVRLTVSPVWDAGENLPPIWPSSRRS